MEKKVNFELIDRESLNDKLLDNLELFIELMSKSSTFAHKAHKELKKLS